MNSIECVESLYEKLKDYDDYELSIFEILKDFQSFVTKLSLNYSDFKFFLKNEGLFDILLYEHSIIDNKDLQNLLDICSTDEDFYALLDNRVIFHSMFDNEFVFKKQLKKLVAQHFDANYIINLILNNMFFALYFLKNGLLNKKTLNTLNTEIKIDRAMLAIGIRNFFDLIDYRYDLTNQIEDDEVKETYQKIHDLKLIHSYSLSNLKQSEHKKLIHLCAENDSIRLKVVSLLQDDLISIFKTFQDLESYLLKKDIKLHLAL